MTVKKANADKPTNRGWFWLVAGLALAAIGGLLLGDSAVLSKQARRTRGWKKAPGVVEESTAETRRFSSNQTRVILRVAYRYRVGGKVYRSRQLNLGTESWSFISPSKASAAYQRYAKGAQVDIYYDPQAPHRAVLERLPAKHGSGRGTAGYVLLGLSLIPLVVFLFWLRNWRRAQKAGQDSA